MSLPVLTGDNTAAAIALAGWFFASVSTVVLNKWLYQFVDFNYPFALTAVHMFTCSVGSGFILQSGLLPSVIDPNFDMNYILYRIAPLSLLFCLNIALGNISLQTIPISFNQTIKASVPAFTFIIQTVVQGKKHPQQRMYSIVPIVGGVMLATFYEVNFHPIGFWTAVASTFTTASWAVVSSMFLTKMNPIVLLYYMGPWACLWLVLTSAVQEYPKILQKGGFQAILNGHKLLLLLLSGLFALLLNVSSFFVIQKTSSLTYTVAGNLKVALSIVASVLIFHNAVTPLNALGCAITILGVMWYQSIKDAEPPKVIQQPPDQADALEEGGKRT